MNRYHFLSVLCFIVFTFLVVYGYIEGQLSFGLAVFIPFVIGEGLYPLIGFFFLFASIIFYIQGLAQNFSKDLKRSDAQPDHPSSIQFSVETGGLVFIGPIPIVFGSNWKVTVIMLLVALSLIHI